MTIETIETRALGWKLPGARRAPRFVRLVAQRPAARVVTWGCLLSFTTLATFVLISEGLLLAVDRGVQTSMLEVRSSSLDTTMVALTFLGTRWVIGAITLGLVVWSLWTGRARPLTAVIVVAVLINPMVELGFKELVDRVRPDTAQLVAGRGPSFPSGHVLASAGFYGMIPLLVWEATRSRAAQLGALIGSLTLILTIGVSRIYLDVHWASDVVAGLLLGTALVVAAGHSYHVWQERGSTHSRIRPPSAASGRAHPSGDNGRPTIRLRTGADGKQLPVGVFDCAEMTSCLESS